MDKLFAVTNYLKYRIKGGTAHDIHSPFVFDLLNNVIRDQTPYYSFVPIEELRQHLLSDEREISVTDFGAGSKLKPSSKKVSEIAKNSMQEKKYSQLIFRLVNFSDSKNILELGTSLGITSLYISNAAKKGKLTTLEGCPEIAKIATENFKKMNAENIELITGDFKETLPAILDKMESIDLVYFDGNHRLQPTLDYFNLCLKKRTSNTVFIFDDIYWSKEMKTAWDSIIKSKEVTVSIDLFKLGIVFFRSGIPKQHFQLKF